MSYLPQSVEAEIAELGGRYGMPRRVDALLEGPPFSPFGKSDRYGEVCMVVRRPNGLLLTAIKTFYPPGAFRLLTGGVSHGEPIADALLREVAEETGLTVRVARFLAVITYRLESRPADPEASAAHTELPAAHLDFATFAFLLDEIGGTLGVHDPAEQIAAFREVTVGELPQLAETLAAAPDTYDHEIDGRWRHWGRFRAVAHRVVYEALAAQDA